MRKIYFFFMAFLFCAQLIKAQPSSHYDIVFKRAELFADSIIKAQEFSDWKTYLELSYPGAVKYYGGARRVGLSRPRRYPPSGGAVRA